ncbi:hypothetical protein ACU686_41295 [Yinghuangia aomiensis]
MIAPLDGTGPTRVGDFDLLCRIGAGGFGEVISAGPAPGRGSWRP